MLTRAKTCAADPGGTIPSTCYSYGSPDMKTKAPHQRFNIAKHDSVTQQRTLVSRSGRAWVGTEPAARVEASRLSAAHATSDGLQRWSYEVVAEPSR